MPNSLSRRYAGGATTTPVRRVGLGTGLKSFALFNRFISATIPLESPCRTRSTIHWTPASSPVRAFPTSVTRILSLMALLRHGDGGGGEKRGERNWCGFGAVVDGIRGQCDRFDGGVHLQFIHST